MIDTPSLLHLPECMRVELSFYLTSDATGLETVMKVGGLPVLATDFDAMASTMCQEINNLLKISDARPMTAEEVSDYERRQREEKNDDCQHEDLE